MTPDRPLAKTPSNKQVAANLIATIDTGLADPDYVYELSDRKLVVSDYVTTGQGKEKRSEPRIQVRSSDGAQLLHTISGRIEVFSPNAEYGAIEP